MRQILACVLALSLAGCAPTIPVMIWKPKPEVRPGLPTPSDVMNEMAVTPRYGAGAIVVSSKERRWFADGCTYDVALDDTPVAGLRPGEQVVLFAEPGQRVVTLSVRDDGSCDPASAQVVMEVVAHSTQKIQLGSSVHHDLKVEVDPYGRTMPP